jgi:acyl-CoA hydrolase
MSEATLVKWTSPLDANNDERVHGGAVTRLCDEAAGLAAIRHTRQKVVTAAIDRMTFLHPVRVGEVLTLRAAVNAVWRTSLEVGVRVESEDPLSGEVRHTSSAYVTMVAIDESGRPAVVPPLNPTGAERRRREREAQLRRANRLSEREQMLAQRSPASSGS